MVNWLYDKSDLRKTPSIIDGISYEVEQRYRREGARFIIKVGTKMNLRYDTMATGVVYYHRFYMCHSFKQFPRFPTACCCMFLAGKVEETPKKCKDIIRTAREFLTPNQFATFGADPKEEVLTLERILLQTINFDLQVDHPYNYLIKYAKSLKGDKEKLRGVVQMAWTFINDSLCTTISLQWEPEVIAVAFCFLAGKLLKFEIIDWDGRQIHHKRWWESFVEDLTIEMLEDICHQVLDLYQIPIPDTPQDSPLTSPVQPSPITVVNSNPTSVQQKNSPLAPTQPTYHEVTRTGPPPLPPPPPPPPPPLNLPSQVLSGLVDPTPNMLTMAMKTNLNSQQALLASSGNLRLPTNIPANVPVLQGPPVIAPTAAPMSGQPFANLSNYGFPAQYSLAHGPGGTIPMAPGPPIQSQLSVPGTPWEFAPHQSYVNFRFSAPDHKPMDHK